MASLIKLGIYAAAGYGTYEIMKRTGALEAAAKWLTDHVPADVQAKIKDQVEQTKGQLASQYENVKGQAQQQFATLKGQAQEQYATLKDQAQGQVESLKGKAQDAYGNAKGQAQKLGDQAQKLGGTASERFEQAKDAVASKAKGQKPVSDNGGMQPAVEEEGDSVHSTDVHSTEASAIGQTITGPGRGVDDATTDGTGATVHHRVGRGVVHG